MTPDNFVKSCLALLAWQEGRRASQNAITAIALVQANRVKAGMGGGDWLHVFELQKETWSAIAPRYKYLTYDPLPDVRDPGFQAVLASAEAVYEGGADTLTDGALFYANLSCPFYDSNGWFHDTVSTNPIDHPRLATIGGFTFFGGKL